MTRTDFIERFKTERGYSPSVGFVGLGISNLALMRDIPYHRITVRDRRLLDRAAIAKFASPRILEGDGYLSEIDEDILVLSPSVRRDTPEIREAAKRGTLLTSDAELYFLDSAGEDYLVTGSDGKSTTATLAALLLSEAHPGTEPIGNIGHPFSESWRHPAAVELSSFQLSYLTPPSRAAIITTVTPNHLNWHTSLDEYIGAKLNIARSTDRLVLSPDTELEAGLIPILKPSVIYSLDHTLERLKSRYPYTDEFITLEGGEIQRNGVRLLALRDILRAERHSIHNLMGAIALTWGKFSSSHLLSCARGFRGLEHRMEAFATYRGAEFINSSIDTTPARTRATLEALSRRVKIILGGGAKGLSILPIAPTLSRFATKIALYGEAGEKYFSELNGRPEIDGIEMRLSRAFDEALLYIIDGLRAGDTVILSPAATGYGEFRDFAERGRYFKEYIKKLCRDRA